MNNVSPGQYEIDLNKLIEILKNEYNEIKEIRISDLKRAEHIIGTKLDICLNISFKTEEEFDKYTQHIMQKISLIIHDHNLNLLKPNHDLISEIQPAIHSFNLKVDIEN